jgi:hypothetical protein
MFLKNINYKTIRMKSGKIQEFLHYVCKSKINAKIKFIIILFIVASSVAAQESFITDKEERVASLSWPPELPKGKKVVTDKSSEFIVKPEHVQLEEGVEIAKEPPTIDFLYFPGQSHNSRLWSVWGDGSTFGSKYYTSFGDHDAPRGEVLVYEYDSKKKKLRLLMDLREFLEQPGMQPEDMDYTPSKIHSRTDIGNDGWVYFSTHRGSVKDNTTDARGYKGDNIHRLNPKTGEKEIVARYPMPKHTIPAGILDPERLIFYGGTAQGNDAPDKGVWFIAYDVKNKKLLKREPGGFNRYAIFSESTGCVFWRELSKGTGDKGDEDFGGRKYDPKTNRITPCPQAPVVRAVTYETKNGIVYGFTGSHGGLVENKRDMWAFDVNNETLKILGPGMVGSQSYVTTMDLDPVTERYVYYVPGAHGGCVKDGTPVVQYDIKTNKRKVIAFLSEFYAEKYGYTPDGTFSTALSPDGSILFITWNGSRLPDAEGASDWDTVAMTAIHIPKSERLP